MKLTVHLNLYKYLLVFPLYFPVCHFLDFGVTCIKTSTEEHALLLALL